MSIDFNLLFNLPNKSLDTELKFKIKEIDAQNELILVSIKNEIMYYKNLIINKSDIWPIPLINDSIVLKHIQYKYDKNYNLRFFIKVNKINENNLFTENNNVKELDFSLKNIIFVYINDYYLETENNNTNTIKKIILSKLSFIEILSDEKIFILLENKEELSKKYLWGKIISIDEINKNKIISILDSKKRILKIENYTNEM